MQDQYTSSPHFGHIYKGHSPIVMRSNWGNVEKKTLIMCNYCKKAYRTTF